jgi:alpha-galactosidase
MLNRGDLPLSIRANADELGYPSRLRARVRDLWAHRNVRRWTGVLEAQVEPHGVAMFRIEP